MLDQRLDAHPDAAQPGVDGVVECRFATQVHDVDGGGGHFRKGHQVMHALGFDHRRAAFVMLAGIGLAGGDQFPRPRLHQCRILAMRGDDDAQVFGQFKRVIKLGVVDAERALVGEKDFEGTDAAPDDFAQLVRGLLVKARHAHVERVIARGFPLGLGHPGFGSRPSGVLLA